MGIIVQKCNHIALTTRLLIDLNVCQVNNLCRLSTLFAIETSEVVNATNGIGFFYNRTFTVHNSGFLLSLNPDRMSISDITLA